MRAGGSGFGARTSPGFASRIDRNWPRRAGNIASRTPLPTRRKPVPVMPLRLSRSLICASPPRPGRRAYDLPESSASTRTRKGLYRPWARCVDGASKTYALMLKSPSPRGRKNPVRRRAGLFRTKIQAGSATTPDQAGRRLRRRDGALGHADKFLRRVPGLTGSRRQSSGDHPFRRFYADTVTAPRPECHGGVPEAPEVAQGYHLPQNGLPSRDRRFRRASTASTGPLPRAARPDRARSLFATQHMFTGRGAE